MSEKKAVVLRTEYVSDFCQRFIFDEPVTLNNGDTLSITWGVEGGNLVGEYIVNDSGDMVAQPTGFDASDPAQMAVARLLLALIPAIQALAYNPTETQIASVVSDAAVEMGMPFEYDYDGSRLRLVTTTGTEVQL